MREGGTVAGLNTTNSLYRLIKISQKETSDEPWHSDSGLEALSLKRVPAIRDGNLTGVIIAGGTSDVNTSRGIPLPINTLNACRCQYVN